MLFGITAALKRAAVSKVSYLKTAQYHELRGVKKGSRLCGLLILEKTGRKHKQKTFMRSLDV